MVYRKQEVSMGLPGLGDYEIFRTSETKVREAKQALDDMRELLLRTLEP